MNEQFKKSLLNDDYIKWLEEFINKFGNFDDVYFVRENREILSSYDIEKISQLKDFYKILIVAQTKLEPLYGGETTFLKYKNLFYVIYDFGEGICCERRDNVNGVSLNYNDFKDSFPIEEIAESEGIKMSNLNDLLEKVLDKPSEFYRKIEDSLTPEERLFIIRHLRNKSCASCTNGSCRIESYEKIGVDEEGLPMGSSCFGWYNSELIGKSKVLSIYDIYKLK